MPSEVALPPKSKPSKVRTLSEQTRNRIEKAKGRQLTVMAVTGLGERSGVNEVLIELQGHLEFSISKEASLQIEPEKATSVVITEDVVIFFDVMREIGSVALSEIWDGVA